MHFIPLCWQFLPIMLALCSMLLPPYYVQNYAGIIGSSLTGGGGDEGSTVEPCPLCGKKFPTIEEVSQHAALCNF